MITLRILCFILLSWVFTPLALAQTPYILTELDEMTLRSNEPITHVWRDKSREDKALDVFGAIDIMASPETIWDIMTDCSRGSDIVKGMLSCTVLEVSADGSDIRHQLFDMGPFLPNAKTEFRSEYKTNRTIKISRTGGDMKIQDAIWELKPLSEDITRVTYRGTIKLKFPVPNRLIKNATRKDTPQIMRNLRRESEADQKATS